MESPLIMVSLLDLDHLTRIFSAPQHGEFNHNLKWLNPHGAHGRPLEVVSVF